MKRIPLMLIALLGFAVVQCQTKRKESPSEPLTKTSKLTKPLKTPKDQAKAIAEATTTLCQGVNLSDQTTADLCSAVKPLTNATKVEEVLTNPDFEVAIIEGEDLVKDLVATSSSNNEVVPPTSSNSEETATSSEALGPIADSPTPVSTNVQTNNYGWAPGTGLMTVSAIIAGVGYGAWQTAKVNARASITLNTYQRNLENKTFFNEHINTVWNLYYLENNKNLKSFLDGAYPDDPFHKSLFIKKLFVIFDKDKVSIIQNNNWDLNKYNQILETLKTVQSGIIDDIERDIASTNSIDRKLRMREYTTYMDMTKMFAEETNRRIANILHPENKIESKWDGKRYEKMGNSLTKYSTHFKAGSLEVSKTNAGRGVFITGLVGVLVGAIGATAGGLSTGSTNLAEGTDNNSPLLTYIATLNEIALQMKTK